MVIAGCASRLGPPQPCRTLAVVFSLQIVISRAPKQLIHCMQAFAATADAFAWDNAGSSQGYAASPVDAEAIAAECVPLLCSPWCHLDLTHMACVTWAKHACRYVGCFNSRDREGMLSLLAEDCSYSSLAYLGSYSTKQVC